VTTAHEEPRDEREGARLAVLMAGFLLGPLAWFLDLQISYALVKWACRHEQRAVLLAIPAGSLLLAGTAVWLSWSSLRTLRGRSRPDGGRPEDRSLFLAAAGLVTSLVFGLLILIAIVPRLALSPCE
jgi:hypothetical protein